MKKQFLLLGIAATLAAGGAFASVAAQQQPPAFRAAAEFVQIDATVLDKDRHPVTGLAQTDFTILEDGKPQRVLSFKAMDAAATSTPSATPAWADHAVADVATNDLPSGRLFVLVLDDALIPPDLKTAANAKHLAADIVDHMEATNRMAVVFTAANRSSQDFTNDRARLHAAVDTLNPKYATWTLGYDSGTFAKSGQADAPSNLDPDGQFFQSSLRVVGNVVDFLAAAPDQRKILIYVSPGVPIDYSLLSPASANGTGNGLANRELHRQLAEQLPELFRRAQRANVAVYAIDPGGLHGTESYVTNQLMSKGMMIDRAAKLAHASATLALDYVNTAAANTGGRAIINTNDFGPGVAAIFNENRSYYLLAYAATDPGSGKMHRLEVKVNRPDVEVLARHGYYASDAKQQTKEALARAGSPLASAMSAMLPKSGVVLTASAAAFAGAAANSNAVAVVLKIREPAPTEAATENMDVMVSAFTPEGTPVGSTTKHLQLKMLPGSDTFQLEYFSRLDLKPGRYELRIAVTSQLANATGSVFADVDVPDFAHAPVALSGVVIDASPRPPVAAKDAVQGIVPVLPTTERVFERRDHASAFVRVYQGSTAPPAPVTLALSIVNDKGETMVGREDGIGAASFDAATRAADNRFALPLDRLQPGDYLLTFTATMGSTTTTRAVKFSVK